MSLRRRSGEAALVLAAAAGVAVLAYVWLMLRARGGPAVNWGSPTSWPALWDHASAARFRVYDVGFAGLLRPSTWRELVGLLLGDGAFGVAALAVAAGTRPGRVGAALLVLVGTSVAFAARYATEDRSVYLLPAFLAMSALAGLGVGRVRARWGRRAAAAALVVVVALPLVAHARAGDRSRSTAARDWGQDILATLPERSVLFAEGDDAFVLAYLVHVEGARPDVEIRERDSTIFPPWAPRLPRAIEEVRASGRPVFLMSWPGVAPPRGLRFEPVGVLWRLTPETAPPSRDEDLWSSYREAAILEEARRRGDFFSATVAATYPLMRGERALFLGRVEDARRHFDDARRIGADSETIRNALGTVFGRRGDYAAAVSEFDAAVRIKPVSTRAWANLATARELAGDVAGAREARARFDALVNRAN